MAPVKLSPTSYLVLGMVASNGPCTPYELKRLVAQTVGNFWTFPHSQLYAEPVRLATAGLLSEERERGGRNRRHYEITEAGRAALRTWLAEPTAQLAEVRDMGMLKLFFSDLGSPDDVAALARAQSAAHRERLRTYETLATDLRGLAGNALRQRPLQMGLIFERASVDFWDTVLDGVRGRAPSAAPRAQRTRHGGARRRVKHESS